MKRLQKVVPGVALVLAMLAGLLWWSMRETTPRIPARFASALTVNCQQVVLVLSPEEHSVNARLWLLERQGMNAWHRVDGPIEVTIGHQGLAWGTGEHQATPPAGFRTKREGDKCSPAGVFRLPFAFGTASAAPEIKLHYTALTPNIIGVDDPKSHYYNQIVDNTKVARDWDSNEAMIRFDKLYEWGAFIANNPANIPGNGSCIFLHLWPAPGQGTAGCTAMDGQNLKRVLAWLDPAKEPRLVQGIEGW